MPTPLGIRPTVDFVFKMLLARPESADLLMHLLNAVLQLDDPIDFVDILNPFNEKEFADDKLSIVDIKARDSQGRWFVIEMQTTLSLGLRSRLVYYECDLFSSQLLQGQGYSELGSAISICFLTVPMFPNIAAGHFEFVLHDVENGVTFGDQLAIHIVELAKYNFSETSAIGMSHFHQWMFFLFHAHEYEATALRDLLPSSPFEKATNTLQMISHTPELRLRYDDSAKAEWDRTSAINDAREIGEIIGRIRVLQDLLGLPVEASSNLANHSMEKLVSQANELQAQVNKRD